MLTNKKVKKVTTKIVTKPKDAKKKCINNGTVKKIRRHNGGSGSDTKPIERLIISTFPSDKIVITTFAYQFYGVSKVSHQKIYTKTLFSKCCFIFFYTYSDSTGIVNDFFTRFWIGFVAKTVARVLVTVTTEPPIIVTHDAFVVLSRVANNIFSTVATTKYDILFH